MHLPCELKLHLAFQNYHHFVRVVCEVLPPPRGRVGPQFATESSRSPAGGDLIAIGHGMFARVSPGDGLVCAWLRDSSKRRYAIECGPVLAVVSRNEILKAIDHIRVWLRGSEQVLRKPQMVL